MFAAIRVLPVGETALLFEFEDQQIVLDYFAEIVERRKVGWCPSIIDVIPAERTILINGVSDCVSTINEVLSWTVSHDISLTDSFVEVPTIYDGEDLDDVAHFWNMTRQEVIATHIGTDFRVAFCGFMPGFAYLVGLPDELVVPRRSTSRTKVPVGSVGLAGKYSGIYPKSSPGGWQLIGRSSLELWDEKRDPPSLLSPGMRVRFVDVGA